ncbi:MAG: ABC transporter permease [Halodesulfurarchaeum sp.]
MRNRLRLALRELASLRAEKTIVLAILIQLFVAAFSSFLVVGLVSLYDPGATQGGYTVDIGVSGNASDELAPYVEQGPSRRAITYENQTALMTDFTRGRLDAALHATLAPDGQVHVDAFVPEGDFRSTLIVVQVKEALSAMERERRLALSHRLTRSPLPVPSRTDANPYFGFTYTILVPMLAFLPAFISGSIAADSLAEEIERGTLDLLRATPLSLQAIIDGKALTMITIAPAQAALWFVFLVINGTAIANPLPILVLVTALAAILVVLGAGLSILIEVRREAQLLYSFLSLGLFGAAMLLPESPPNVVAKLAVGSPTLVTYGTVAGLVVVAVFGYYTIRTTAASGRLSE